MKKLALIIAITGTTLCSNAQIISTIAGNGSQGYTGDGASAILGELYHPSGVAVDTAGNIYIADYDNNVVRMVTASTGFISTVAGNNTSGYSGDGGLATSAELWGLTAVAVDKAGNIYIADADNNVIRKVTKSTGFISTVAGNNTAGYSGDGAAATLAELNGPCGVSLDASGNIYVSDCNNNVIRKVTISTGIITTIAGNGTSGYSGDGASAILAELNKPHGVAIDAAGNIYISDDNNNVIRKVTLSSGFITTVAGNGTAGYSGDGGLATSAELLSPSQVALDGAGNIYIADGNNAIRKITISTGLISTYAGTGTPGFSGDSGPATSAQLNGAVGVNLDNKGNVYIADEDNQRIRKVTATCTPDITTGLVADYFFTGNAKDSSGNNNNGTVYGCTLVPDRFANANSAYSFDGNDDSIVVPNSSTLQFTSNSQSISFWIKMVSLPNPANNNEAIINKVNQNLGIDPTGASAQGFYVAFGQLGNGTINYAVEGWNGVSSPGAGVAISSTLLTINKWEHIVFTCDSARDSVYGYLNGSLVQQTLIPNGTFIGKNTDPLLIGYSTETSSGFPEYLFGGILDDIRFYNVALSQCSIDSLYNMTNPVITVVNPIFTKDNSVLVYPNPATSEVNIKTNGQKFIETIITDLLGRVVYDKSFTNQVNISGIEPGCYIITLKDVQGNIYRQRIVKE